MKSKRFVQQMVSVTFMVLFLIVGSATQTHATEVSSPPTPTPTPSSEKEMLLLKAGDTTKNIVIYERSPVKVTVIEVTDAGDKVTIGDSSIDVPQDKVDSHYLLMVRTEVENIGERNKEVSFTNFLTLYGLQGNTKFETFNAYSEVFGKILVPISYGDGLIVPIGKKQVARFYYIVPNAEKEFKPSVSIKEH